MLEKNFNAKAIVEIGIITAILAILILANSYLPLASLFINFLLPIPGAYIYIRYGVKGYLVLMAVTFAVSLMLIDPISAASMILVLLIMSLAVGFCIKKEINIVLTMGIIAVCYILYMIFQYTVIIKLVSGISFTKLINDIVKSTQSTINDAKNLYISSGMSKSQVEEMLDPINQIFSKQFILSIIPTIVILSALFYSYVTCLISTKVLKRIGIKVQKMLEFTKIHMPNLVLAFGIIILCIGMILDNRGFAFGNYVYITVSFVGQFLLLICGVSLVVNHLKYKLKMKSSIIALIIIITLLISVIGYIYVFIGFVDSIIDFRKIELGRINKKNG